MDPAATRDYENRLAARLEHLRALNASLSAPSTAVAMNATPTMGNRISFKTGGENSPSLEIPIDGGAGVSPVTVETLFTRPEGKIVTRRSQVIRQGGKVDHGPQIQARSAPLAQHQT